MGQQNRKLILPGEVIYSGENDFKVLEILRGHISGTVGDISQLRMASDCRGVDLFSDETLFEQFGRRQEQAYSVTPDSIRRESGDLFRLLLRHPEVFGEGVIGLKVTNGPVGDAKKPLSDIARVMGIGIDKLPVAIIYEGGSGVWCMGEDIKVIYDASELERGAAEVVRLIKTDFMNDPAINEILRRFTIETSNIYGDSGFRLTVGLCGIGDTSALETVGKYFQDKNKETSGAYGRQVRSFTKGANDRLYVVDADASKQTTLEEASEPGRGIFDRKVVFLYGADAAEDTTIGGKVIKASSEEQKVICSDKVVLGISIRLDGSPETRIHMADVVEDGKVVGKRMVLSTQTASRAYGLERALYSSFLQ